MRRESGGVSEAGVLAMSAGDAEDKAPNERGEKEGETTHRVEVQKGLAFVVVVVPGCWSPVIGIDE
ncbi:hypothetical protein AMTR_s00006p00263270 [Amborella trichopoda]|uniref:Uncharacterized protein n=1 Tax=Amborella trichopoda TaxID=13333 RepID=W1PD22_AMBTC|nr:hypothetical protein AMTR_s00006p00263270 [Amborella trichopoda]